MQLGRESIPTEEQFPSSWKGSSTQTGVCPCPGYSCGSDRSYCSDASHRWQPHVQDVIRCASLSGCLSENRWGGKYLTKRGSVEPMMWWEFLSWNCSMLVQGVLPAVWQKHWHSTKSIGADEDKPFGWELSSFLRHFWLVLHKNGRSTTSQEEKW